jgi:hypothetical protein
LRGWTRIRIATRARLHPGASALLAVFLKDELTVAVRKTASRLRRRRSWIRFASGAIPEVVATLSQARILRGDDAVVARGKAASSLLGGDRNRDHDPAE